MTPRATRADRRVGRSAINARSGASGPGMRARPGGRRTWPRRSIWIVAAFAVLVIKSGGVHAAEPDVRVRTSLDRTAAWVADRVTYTVEVVCRPGVDILDEDLSRDKLKLDGLDILSVDAARDTAADGTVVHRFTYSLTIYRIDIPELRIAPMSVRYYVKRPGQRLQDAVPAGEAEVPGASVALRSTLPDAQNTASLRDQHAPPRRAAMFSLAQPVGVGLVIASIAPVLFWGAAYVARRRDRASHRTARQVRIEERASIESTRSLDVTSADARREAYTRINTLVRDHLREVCGVAGPSLTPAEVTPALTARGSRMPADTVAALLAECERARYAPPDGLPSADACRDALAQAEQVLAIR